MTLRVGVVAALTLMVIGAAHGSERRYNDRMFREAVEQRLNTSRPFVLVTIVDGTTGAQKTGCTEISALAAAVALQMGWTKENPRPDDHEVDNILLNAKAHRFVFNQERWLVGSGYYSLDQNEQACRYLRRGIPAFRADLTGQIVAGTPGHALTVLPPQNGAY